MSDSPHTPDVASKTNDRAWVAKVRDPKQRALATFIPAVCDMFGLTPADLGNPAGSRLETSPEEYALTVMRGLCLGAVADLGRRLGIRWNDLHGRECLTVNPIGRSGEVRETWESEHGRTEVIDLRDRSRSLLQKWHSRFLAFADLPHGSRSPLAHFIAVTYGQICEDAARSLLPKATPARGRKSQDAA